jgi:hypothetical protein
MKLTLNKTSSAPRPALLLHPNVPKPLHGMSPRELLGTVWWDKARQEAYERANYCCQACGTPKTEAEYHKWLEAHETYVYDYKTGTATVSEIVALCHMCHNYIHSGRLKQLLQADKITTAKYWHIILHGDKLLKDAGLIKPEPTTVNAAWNKWKIIIDGREFPTKWKSFDHWKNHYDGGE